LQNVVDAINQNDSARLATELDAIDAHVGPVPDRIGNLMTDWEKGDAWLTDLDGVAGTLLAFTTFVRDGKPDQAINTLSSGTDLLRSVVDRYKGLGLGCSVP
jgi:hypothetical protein